MRYNHNQTFVVRASCPQNVYLIPSQTAVSWRAFHIFLMIKHILILEKILKRLTIIK